MFNAAGCSVNLTETEYSLAMITKAGVPSNKITVGVSSYGRSFGVLDPSCLGPQCLFGGPGSTASPGICTGEAGYLADAEIAQLLSQGAEFYHDQASDSDIVVSNGNWVAYMNQDTKASRADLYRRLNFLGTVDWAIDLEGGSLSTTNGSGVSPDNVGIIPIPGCTTLAPSATFTLTPLCATAIAALPPSGSHNNPPGPDFCTEACDLLQLITATCCGAGGTIGNPIVVQPNVPLPASLPLQQGFVPAVPMVIPGTTYPVGTPLPYAVEIPKGSNIPDITFPLVVIGPSALQTPFTIPPGALPSVPFSVNDVFYPAEVSLSGPVTFPVGYTPEVPIVFPPFILPDGVSPIDINLPKGYIPVVGLPVPAATFPPNIPIPKPILLPPGITFPGNLPIPSGAPLVVAPPGILPGDPLPSPPPPVEVRSETSIILPSYTITYQLTDFYLHYYE